MTARDDETLKTLHRLRLDTRAECEAVLAQAREGLRVADNNLARERTRLASLAPAPARDATTITSGTLQRDLLCDEGLSHARALATRRVRERLSAVVDAQAALDLAEQRWRDAVAEERVIATQQQRHEHEQRRLATRREDDDNDDLAQRR